MYCKRLLSLVISASVFISIFIGCGQGSNLKTNLSVTAPSGPFTVQEAVNKGSVRKEE